MFDELRGMEREMEDLTRRMSEISHESPQYTQVADRFHRIEHEVPDARRLRDRGQSGDGSDGTRLPQRRLDAADR